VANALASESSPYLRQHAENPVDWVPWGPAVLAAARELNRPVLVSIGYSACHWCHVMAHESFEDPQVAELMNRSLVCVKVDREERPDVDAVCMEACQRMTGQGGWPLNVFLTPEGEPFFAGTYFPPEGRQGMAAWSTVVQAVSDAWGSRPDAVRDQAAQLTAAISASAQAIPAGEPVAPAALSEAVTALEAGFDSAYAGWGGAPKFPPHSTLEFLLARAAQPQVPDAARARDMALATLGAMAVGGIYDQVGGGFARYTVDGTWTVPHFEKMLYDNGLLARSFLRGYQLSGAPRFAAVVTETLDFCLAELRRDDGGFCSALDADSEGVEGKFYVWTLDELRAVLGSDPELFDAAVAFFGASAAGNFEGANVLEGRGRVPERLGEIRARLLAARGQRVRPGLDDKRVTAWNALMIAALADAGGVLGRPDYLEAATECAHALMSGDELMRTGSVPAFLDDYAYLVEALVTLYEATWEPRWYAEAVRLADVMIARFGDAESGGFFTTPVGHDDLVGRRRDLEDAPIPSGSSAAAQGLLRLARLAGSVEYERQALAVLAAHGPLAVRHPGACGHLLLALDFYLADDVREVALVGAGPDGELAALVRSTYRPHLVLAGTPKPLEAVSPPEPGDSPGVVQPGGSGNSLGVVQPGGSGDSLGAVPLLEHRGRLDGAPAAYVCERFVCQAPVSEPAALAALLDG
jgi:uncharacterized protein YyaL (SSP411 family)